MRKIELLSTFILSVFSVAASAEQHGLSCQFHADSYLPLADKMDIELSPIDVKADDAVMLKDGTSVFYGNVEIERTGQAMKSDEATYNRQTGEMTATGNVQLRDSDMIVDAEKGEWSQSAERGQMENAHYRLRETHSRGEATFVERFGQTLTNMDSATYTTCPDNSDAWLLEADEVQLDHVEDVGVAKDVVLRVADVPVFYTPYISFPLSDKRKSGFLIPSIGTSAETGFETITPYYWNIAPNYDATLIPRYMTDRGLMLGGEFRYLFDWGEGELNATHLNEDKQESDGDILNPYYQQKRQFFSWKHKSKFADRWSALVDYNYASDENYLEDFGTSLNSTSQSVLRRKAETKYNGDIWDFTARLQAFQPMGDTNESYRRLPQLLWNAYLPDQALGMTYQFNSEYVDFDHKLDSQVQGQRINLEPIVSMPIGSAGYFITPRLALNYTKYNLNHDVSNSYDQEASRFIPITSIDSGLIFERDTSLNETSYTQTLEPRAFYLYVPEKDQSEIPDFDTSEATFNMSSLFYYDRFVGRDRIGDANQLSLALTSRYIDNESGKERFRTSMGQIRYFKDREVTLGSRAVDSSNYSDIINEVVAYIDDEWTVKAEIQWDPKLVQSNMSYIGTRYRGKAGHVFNIAHRYRRADARTNTRGDKLDQIDISTQIPIARKWQLFGRWYRSIAEGRTMEGLAGVQYDSCCWASRLVVRNFVNDADDEDRNLAIYFQIELKGLGKFGNQSEGILSQSIPGYRER